MEASSTETMPSTSFGDMLPTSDATTAGFSSQITSANQSEGEKDCSYPFAQLLSTEGSGIDMLAATLPASSGVEEKNDVGALSVFYLVVCIIGLLGNIAVITLILSQKELKKGITVWYILQLAIADMLFLSTIPFQFHEDKYSRWTLSESLCKFKQSITFINFYSSISFLTVMAIDRYIAVCHSMTEGSQKLRTRKAAYMITAFVWIACISASSPVMKNSVVEPPESKCELSSSSGGTAEESCQNLLNSLPEMPLECCIKVFEGELGSLLPFDKFDSDVLATSPEYEFEEVIQVGCSYYGHPQWVKVLIVANFSVFVIMCFIIVACYTLIMRHLWTKAFHVKGASTNNRRNRNRVIYMCITLVIVFVASWLPYHVQNLAKLNGIVGRSSTYCENLSYATSLLLYVNSTINPFIYFFIARLKSHIKTLRSSRAASVMITLFSRHENAGDRTPTTKRCTRIETKKNDAKYAEGKLSTELLSNV